MAGADDTNPDNDRPWEEKRLLSSPMGYQFEHKETWEFDMTKEKDRATRDRMLNSHGQPADRPGGSMTLEQSRAVDLVLREIQTALYAAYRKHAPMHSPHEGHSVIREEFEELWEHVTADTGRSPEARKEAIQLAAMAVRYVVDLIDGDKR